MAVIDISSATVSLGAVNIEDGGRTVLWLRGEHDASTAAELHATMARAIALDAADVVVDLSEAEFIDASTIGVIVRAHNSLVSQSRSLVVRGPTAGARRIFEVCELSSLLEG